MTFSSRSKRIRPKVSDVRTPVSRKDLLPDIERAHIAKEMRPSVRFGKSLQMRLAQEDPFTFDRNLQAERGMSSLEARRS